MNIRNYTSTVPASKSVEAIERLLVAAGATHIMRQYADGSLTGFVFALAVAGKSITFKLPSNPSAVKRLLEKERSVMRRIRPETIKRLQEQSERTAWKLLYDWMSVQISLIQMGQADAVQVFLPYAYNPLTEKTVYEQFKEGGFKALAAGKEVSR